MGFQINDDDASVKITRALANANETVASTGIDLGNSAKGDFVAACELEIAAPALTTGELADAKTQKYDVFHDVKSDFSTETKLFEDVIVQTGAGGAGAAAATVALRLPVDVKQFLRVKITGEAAGGDASAKQATIRLRF
jgi:hypothetical protein